MKLFKGAALRLVRLLSPVSLATGATFVKYNPKENLKIHRTILFNWIMPIQSKELFTRQSVFSNSNHLPKQIRFENSLDIVCTGFMFGYWKPRGHLENYVICISEVTTHATMVVRGRWSKFHRSHQNKKGLGGIPFSSFYEIEFRHFDIVLKVLVSFRTAVLRAKNYKTETGQN